MPNIKVSREKAGEALRLRRQGFTLDEIGRRLDLGVGRATISKIVRSRRAQEALEPTSYAPAAQDGKAGSRIRAAREAAGLDRRDLAGRLGVTYQRLADIEADRKPITLESILSVAAALGVDPHGLDDRLASRKPAAGR